jgi:hypothetical protein
MSKWQVMPSPLPGMEVWGIQHGRWTYIITRDTGISQDDPYYGKFFLTAKPGSRPTIEYGHFATLEAAQHQAANQMMINRRPPA